MDFDNIASRVASRRYSGIGMMPVVTLIQTKTGQNGHITQKWSIDAHGKMLTLQSLSSEGGHAEVKDADFDIPVEGGSVSAHEVIKKLINGPAEPAELNIPIQMDDQWLENSGIGIKIEKN